MYLITASIRTLGPYSGLCKHSALSYPSFFPSKIEPNVKSNQDHCTDSDEGAGKFEINDFLDVVDNEGPRVQPPRVMLQSEPDLEIGEGTVPTEDLGDESKAEAGKVKNFSRSCFFFPRLHPGTENKNGVRLR